MGDKVFISRRRFLQAGAALSGAMLLPGVMQAAWAAGSDKPELATVRVGFIPLTDCAPLAIAALKGFDKKYGISLQPSKEASWAAVRDKLVAGELDAAHILYGMLYGLELGIAGKPQQMANLMTLNRNGQATTLSSDLQAQGVSDGHGLKRLIDQKSAGQLHLRPHLSYRHSCDVALLLAGERRYRPLRRCAHGGRAAAANGDEHAHRQYGWLLRWRTHGTRGRSTIALVLRRQPASRSGRIIRKKILGARSDWVARYPNTARALVAALLEAQRWIEASADNTRETARILARRAWLNTKRTVP